MAARRGGASSTIKIATARPSGTPITSEPNVSQSEPTIIGSSPNCGGLAVGFQVVPVRNGHRPTSAISGTPAWNTK